MPLPQRVSIFYDFFTLKFSPVKFVQPLGGVVQIKCVYDFFTHTSLNLSHLTLNIANLSVKKT